MMAGGSIEVRRCGWTGHLPRDAALSANLRRWVTGEGSLTARLMAASSRFGVTCLSQGMERPLADEWQALGLDGPVPVLARDVLLSCDGVAAVYGHTVVMPDRFRRDWPFLNRLGERPLGGVLFTDPRVRRDAFAFARLFDHHPLRRRLLAAIGAAGREAAGRASPLPFPYSSTLPRMLPARRSVFRRESGVMLVTEVFLPNLLGRAAPDGVPPMPKRAPRALTKAAPAWSPARSPRAGAPEVGCGII